MLESQREQIQTINPETSETCVLLNVNCVLERITLAKQAVNASENNSAVALNNASSLIKGDQLTRSSFLTTLRTIDFIDRQGYADVQLEVS